MRHVVGRLLLLCCIVSPFAFAQEAEPYHVKSDVLGESLATFKQNHQSEKVDCPNLPSAPEELRPLQFCQTILSREGGVLPGLTNEPFTYAGEPSSGRIAWFNSGILYKIVYLFNFTAHENDYYYKRLLQPLTEKFGKPTEEKELEFPNLTGSNVKNHVAVWRNGVSTIRLEQFADGASDSHSTQLIFSFDKLAADAEQRQYKARHAKSDM